MPPKVGLKCSDGRTIMEDAFSANNGETVPLVWQHLHNDPDNILGHALLENRKDGVYAYCVFNDTKAGTTAKQLVEHGDVNSLSIYANSLIEKSKQVIHGIIREVSLVVAGANPGAKIESLAVEHADGSILEVDDEAVITTGDPIELGDLKHADSKENDGDKTIGDIFDTLTDEQKTVVYAMISHALESSDDDDTEDNKENKDTKEVKHSNIEGEENNMKKKYF